MCVIARYPQWVPIAVCGALYGTAFALPATVTSGGEMGLSGYEAYGFAWGFRDYRWLANPAAWLAALLLAWRLWPWAALFSLGAFGIAVSSAVRVGLGEWESTHGLGYWLWSGSMALLCVTTLAGWFGAVPCERRRSPLEVFRGWRGVAVASWIGFGLGVLAFGWFFDDIYPPHIRTTGGERPQTTRHQVGGVSFEFEYRPGAGYSIGNSERFLSGVVGSRSIDFRDGELTIDGIDHGRLKPGDTFRLPLNGKPLVNGKPLAPFPIRPVRLTNPPLVMMNDLGVARALAWRPDGTLVVLHDERRVDVLNPGNGDPANPPRWIYGMRSPTAGAPQFLAISPNGKRAAIGEHGEQVFLWDIGEQPPDTPLPGKERAGAVAFLSDDWLAEVRGKQLLARHLAGPATTVVPLSPVLEYNPRPIAVSSDGKVIARLVEGDKLALSRVTVEGNTLSVTPGLTLNGFGYDTAPFLNHDGSLLFAYADHPREKDDYRGLVIVETATGQVRSRLRWRFTPGMAIQIQSGSFSPDSSLLALGEIDSVRVYDVASGRERAWAGSGQQVRLDEPREQLMGWVHAVAFSPDGRYLAAGTGKGKLPSLMVWETKQFTEAGKK